MINANVKHWELIADNLSKASFSWGCSSETDATGRVLYTADAYRNDGKRFTVIGHDRLTAFLQLESATRLAAVNTVYWQRITMSNLLCTTER